MPTLCYQDLIDHVTAYGGDDATTAGSAKFRKAVHAAYSVVATRHAWQYLWTIGRVTTAEPYSTGTIAFDLTGGANERQLTLTGGTWPSWAADGYVRIDGVPYSVSRRVSDSILVLAENDCPAADVAALTEYELLRDSYPLPTDFVNGDETVMAANGSCLEYVHPREWMNERRQGVGPGQPWRFSYVGNPNATGTLRMVLSPVPDGVYYIDFLYRRRPRPLFYLAEATGLVTATTASTTVTGTNTRFHERMVGSIIRFGEDNQVVPSGPAGDVPALYERLITAVASTTSLTIDSVLDENLTSVTYAVTDPIDIDQDMTEYMLREVENQYRLIARSMVVSGNVKMDESKQYELAFLRALEADAKTTSRAAALRRQSRRSGLLQYPIDFGV